MELAKEVRDAGVRLRQSFQHHLGLGASMLGQQDFAEPSLAHDLQDIELVDQIHLFDRVKRKDSAVLNLNKIGRMANIKDTMRQLLFCIEIWKMRVFLIRGMHDFDRSWDRFFGSKRIFYIDE